MNKKPIAQIGSLDLFWMPQLALALGPIASCELLSTWSLQKTPPVVVRNINFWSLHYALAFYKRFPALQRNNHTYLSLCKAFDTFFTSKLNPEMDILYFLSGCGTKAMRQAHLWDKPVVVDSGSTHTDFQHHIVWEEYKRNGLRNPLFPEAYRNRVKSEFAEADFIQIPSEFVKRTYLEAGIPENKLLKAKYGANVEMFQPRQASNLSPVFRFICPSGVNLRKGARLLVEAWRKMAWHASEAELHWIGSPDHPNVRHLFNNPLRGVFWHDWMPHSKLCELYRSCDALILPSFEEGLARVLIEGAASGLALIATPNTGVEDFFTPDHNEGWLISSNSIDELCSALEEARNDRQRTFEIGQRAAFRARQGFSWDDYGRQVRANFKQIFSVSPQTG